VASKLFPMLSCADLQRSLTFYGGLLGGTETYRFPVHAQEAGFEAVAEPADVPWGERIAWIADPDGNLVMLTR